MESGVDFVAADMPQANRLTVHIMAAFAEHEAHAISERTKAVVTALKARGVKLGNPRWNESIGKARSARIRKMTRPSPAVLDIIQRMRMESASLRTIAARLNELGVTTPGGSRWHASTVRLAIRTAQLSSIVQSELPGPAVATVERWQKSLNELSRC
jgi:DNA invertase Pin-like site-specific DNA recombinase